MSTNFIKKPGGIALIVIVILLAICGMNGCSTYNSLVTDSEKLDKTWADVQNQYQRRLDLIPNLVETVKGYAKHESETFQNVTEARAGLQKAYNEANDLKDGNMESEQDFANYNAAQQQLSRQFSIYVNAVKEAYPDLKANEQFMGLQTQLEGTENRIATERRNYTEAVQQYNIKVRRFPASIWASMFGFEKRPQFAAEAEAQHAPKVSF